MAYFHCLIGGGSSGGGYELTVTCDADFAGTTITATDGVTTLTKTCPSASPYEVTFEIPNGGDWTISGVVGGHTVSTGVSIPTSASLIATIQQTVTIYSAKEDTISYVDIDGATQTITFASGETSKQVDITIEPSGSSITFTSSVAKDPSDLTASYSKTVTIDSNTTEVYVMPENTLYWYGFQDSDLQVMNTTNGWSSSKTWGTPTYQTNTFTMTSNASSSAGLGSNSKHTCTKVHAITQGISVKNNVYGWIGLSTSKNYDNIQTTEIRSNSVSHYTATKTSAEYYIGALVGEARDAKCYALWYE